MDTLFCLNGVRVMSIGWIVLGNVYMILYLNPDVVGESASASSSTSTRTSWVSLPLPHIVPQP